MKNVPLSLNILKYQPNLPIVTQRPAFVCEKTELLVSYSLISWKSFLLENPSVGYVSDHLQLALCYDLGTKEAFLTPTELKSALSWSQMCLRIGGGRGRRSARFHRARPPAEDS